MGMGDRVPAGAAMKRFGIDDAVFIIVLAVFAWVLVSVLLDALYVPSVQ